MPVLYIQKGLRSLWHTQLYLASIYKGDINQGGMRQHCLAFYSKQQECKTYSWKQHKSQTKQLLSTVGYQCTSVQECISDQGPFTKIEQSRWLRVAARSKNTPEIWAFYFTSLYNIWVWDWESDKTKHLMPSLCAPGHCDGHWLCFIDQKNI